MKNSTIYILTLLLLSCTSPENKGFKGNRKQQNNIVNFNLPLNDTLIINKDLSISYLKIDSLNYSDFNKKDKMRFIEKGGGGLSCGNSDPVWDSFKGLINDSLGLELTFSKVWIDNQENDKEEVLSKITLDNAKAKFYNGITIGKSNITETKIKFGKPEKEGVNFLRYKFETIYVSLIYNKAGILDLVQLRKS